MFTSGRAGWQQRRALQVARVCGAFFLGSLVSTFGGEVAKESQIKAAFLYNFTKFVEWPPSAFASSDEPIVIGILGTSPVSDELQNVVRGRKVNGRSLVVVPALSRGGEGTVHVLFVAAGAENILESRPGVLTVGESDRFAALGGMITFIADAEKVKFAVNLGAAEQAELKISAQLLKLASTVRRKP